MKKLTFVLACLAGIFLAVRQKQDPPSGEEKSKAPGGQKGEVAQGQRKPPTYRPVKNESRWFLGRDPKASGELEIGNGNDHAALVKLISLFVNRKACACVILPKSSLKIGHIPDGRYRVEFALGDEIIAGTEKFWEPIDYRKMVEPLVFSTTVEVAGNRIITKSPALRITVHGVEGGNARCVSILSADFDRY